MVEVLEQYGPYTRVRRLGMGGMAETFLAVQRGAAGFEQRVCMKFILPGYRENADFRRLFLREASIAASLRHSNIVGVIDVDEQAGYLVLELVDGVDLRTLLNAAPNHRLPGELATLVTLELCKALAYAHGRNRYGQFDGIVHRDISPSNVLVSYAGEVKLTDFGVARAMRADAEPLSTTVKGKLCYMSPEQARGQVLDGRSDLFSLGIVCYELLSGQRPFDGQSDADTLLRVTAGQHTPLTEVAPDVPGGLATVVEKLLSRDREQRFASADACIDALARFAPRVTSFRELGDMARAARPHETLPSYEGLALESTVQGAPRSRPTLTETQGLPDGSRPPRTSISDAGRSPASISDAGRSPASTSDAGRLPVDEQEATPLFGRSLERVNRNAWSALGISLVLLLGVASAWAARLSVDPPAVPVASRPPRLTSTTPPPSAAGAVALEAAQFQAPNLVPASDSTRVAPAPLSNLPGSVGPRDAAPQTTHSDPPRQRAHAEEGKGTLTVGAMPIAQIWVDGHLLGWSPQTLELRAGVHNVAAGNTRREVQRSLRVRAGETQQFIFNLDKDARGGNRGDDTTLEPADR
jgi:serine/threonine protein kinase